MISQVFARNPMDATMQLKPEPQISFSDIQEVLPEHNYHFLKPVGAGGFGSVFLVHSDKYNQEFCIKKIKQREPVTDETKGEAITLLRLCHPNIISMYEFFFDEAHTNLYIVLEYCSGGSFQELLEREGPIRSPKLYSYCYQILKALLYCHEQNVAHRDIKPANIFLDNCGRPKLADFGLSKKVDKGETTKVCAGSRPYMAPEVISYQKSDPFLADIWSLGITFYCLAFGKLPWIYHNNEELEMAIKTGVVSFPSYADARFCRLIRSMTAINPAKREPLTKLLSSPIFDNIQKYNYSTLCPLHKSTTENASYRRSTSLLPSTVSQNLILPKRINNLTYIQKKPERKGIVRQKTFGS
ncbi:CAMK family protein kinase [Histomonas meleagridis]|uniref:CAMK family protein kinase n=1 Tax=Histomonas meleagridis TaxID=135588 RepID=UPI00355AB60A|nr:CAMK family protein kinase [Histomonas meleagridis]KAH0805728.1 CAMK family protein kinase [Histomonas meleagridis]